MLRLIAIFLLALQPLPARALCEGSDLIAALPEADRTAIAARATAAPYPEGLLWQARKGDTRITLFGTYHFRHAETDTHLDRLKPLIEEAETVFLEMSLEDQDGFQHQLVNDPSIMFITRGTTLPDLLGDADWQHFSEEMEKRQIPAFMAAKFKPLWAAMMLGIGPCEARNGAMNGIGIDRLVGEHAESHGIPTRSLENFADVLVQLDSDPLDKQLDMIRMTLAWPGNADDMSFTVRERYLEQQVALTWEFSRLVSLQYGGPTAEQDFDRLEQIMLTDRNTAWAAKLAHEAAGKTTLVAVGAGHFPGDTGLLNLLEQQGFMIERLPLRP